MMPYWRSLEEEIEKSINEGNFNFIEIIAPLIENPNACGPNGYTPLQYATAREIEYSMREPNLQIHHGSILKIIKIFAPLTANNKIFQFLD